MSRSDSAGTVPCHASRCIWCSRGKTWDFRLLSFGGWASSEADVIYDYVFLDPKREYALPGFWRGELICPDLSVRSFLAARVYTDGPVLEDESGRPIPHEVIFCGTQLEVERLLSTDWVQAFIDAVSDTFFALYNSEAIGVDSGQLKVTEDVFTATCIEKPPLYEYVGSVSVKENQAKEQSGSILRTILGLGVAVDIVLYVYLLYLCVVLWRM